MEKISIQIFHDLMTNQKGFDISNSVNRITFLLENDDSMTLFGGLGGILTKEKAKALRDFLDDLLEKNHIIPLNSYDLVINNEKK